MSISGSREGWNGNSVSNQRRLTADHVACKIVIRNSFEALGKRGPGEVHSIGFEEGPPRSGNAWRKLLGEPERILLAPSSLLPAEAETRSSDALGFPEFATLSERNALLLRASGPDQALRLRRSSFTADRPPSKTTVDCPLRLVQEVTRTPLRLADDGAQHRSLGKPEQGGNRP